VGVLDEARHDFGVERGLERDALLLQLSPQRVGVQEVAVVRQRTRAQRRVMERKRMRVLGPAGAGGRVPGVAEPDH